MNEKTMKKLGKWMLFTLVMLILPIYVSAKEAPATL